MTYYYKAPRTRLESAQMFGVVLRDPFGQSSYYYDETKRMVYKEIGVVDMFPKTGRIAAWPMEKLTTRETEMLIGTAELAFRESPCKARGWRFNRRKGLTYWRSYVSVPVHPDHDHVAGAIAASLAIRDQQYVKLNKQMTEVDAEVTQ